MQAIKLKTEHMNNPLGIDIKKPFLSWIAEDGITQTAYEISASSDGEEIWNSGLVYTNIMHAVFEGELKSRQMVTWKVRLWDETNTPGEWSQEATFEMGLLDQKDFAAKWINPEIEATKEPQPASYLKKKFTVEKDGPGRLYITCHGLYVAYLNGSRVGDFVLAPGTGTYDKKLAYQTYDVSDLIKEGENELLVVLGDGWYRGYTGVDGDRNLFGSDISLFCQLEVDKEVICISDETWMASNRGPIRVNDMQQGETYDATMEEITKWHEVKVEDFGIDSLAASNSVPILEHESFKGRIIKTPNGETVIDFGQNLAGYVEFKVNANKGDKITLWHGEALDENGNFTIENFQPGKRHKLGAIEQKNTYICKDGFNHYKPSFTIMGYQYVKVETDISLEDAEFISHAVYSKMEETGKFTSSNEDLNKLVMNSIWSQKSNFCDIPTDCPTRERAGWTGDAAIFVDTGLYLMDSYSVFRKWLGECRLIQKEDGRVVTIAPPNGRPGRFSEMLYSSVGWGDASIIVPYTMYKRYGDTSILEENYEMMQGWYSFLEKRAKKKNLKSLFKKNPYRDYTIDTGFDFGEWCEPGVGTSEGVMGSGKSVATAYLAYSGKLLSEIAQVLGKEEDAKHYSHVSENAKLAYRHVFTDNGKIKSERQCEYVRPLAFGLLDGQEAVQAAKDLNDLVVEMDYHLNTGFLSTQYLCQVLADYGYLETAYRLLLQDTYPSWLYAVKKGATTIWETWDGIMEDGSVKDSLNHYVYGVISGWMFSDVCGIRVEKEEITISPRPFPLLDHAKAEYDSPIGKIVSGWSYEEDKIIYEFEIPANGVANVELPNGTKEKLLTGYHRIETKR